MAKRVTTKRVTVVGMAKLNPDQKYHVEEAARTIARAAEHLRDGPLMKQVRQHVASQAAAVGVTPTPKTAMVGRPARGRK